MAQETVDVSSPPGTATLESLHTKICVAGYSGSLENLVAILDLPVETDFPINGPYTQTLSDGSTLKHPIPKKMEMLKAIASFHDEGIANDIIDVDARLIINNNALQNFNRKILLSMLKSILRYPSYPPKVSGNLISNPDGGIPSRLIQYIIQDGSMPMRITLSGPQITLSSRQTRTADK
ncbi:hypothetical protein ADUPG1_008273, partial [Aduncisulcus paluster]